jgi:hypothetical protein
MKAKRLTEEQIIGVLKEAEAGAKAKDLCRKRGRLGGGRNWKPRTASSSAYWPMQSWTRRS